MILIIRWGYMPYQQKSKIINQNSINHLFSTKLFRDELTTYTTSTNAKVYYEIRAIDSMNKDYIVIRSIEFIPGERKFYSLVPITNIYNKTEVDNLISSSTGGITRVIETSLN